MTMPRQPAYFESIRLEAHKRWNLLEKDPKLAGPWRQLFSQVKSPRHVLSELIQNADDAGAKWIKVRLADGVFVFEHDGRDFDEESFSSLCQFGVSNKRFLHTIGFRGLGFKSTFSLGPRVQVHSPTLAVEFHEKRFTEPVWIEGTRAPDHTRIQISVTNREFKERFEDDLERWVTSPVPLLFFHNIRELDLQGEKIIKNVTEKGPIARSEWVQLKTSTSKQRVLHIQSKEESFPDDARQEIQRERGTDEKFDLPPCVIDVVLGLNGTQRLYVVLPSEVRPDLPFSCNAPFLQDPARNGIRELSMSATNRWLLERVGRLAADSMIEWLEDKDLSAKDRADAYDLLPAWTSARGSLAEEVATRVVKCMSERIKGQNCLLTVNDTLSNRQECLATPPDFLDIWDKAQILKIFGERQKDVLASEIDDETRQRLDGWGLVEVIDTLSLLKSLAESASIPRPETFEGLIELWNFCKTAVDDPGFAVFADSLKIIPIMDADFLGAATDVMTLGETGQKLSQADLKFLLQRVHLVDPKWVEALTRSSQGKEKSSAARLRAAINLFQQLGLNQRVGAQQVIERVADQVFAHDDPGEEGIQLVRIAARGDIYPRADLRTRFKFLCRDKKWRTHTAGLMVEVDHEIESLLPEAWAASRLLHSDYQANLRSNERAAWRKWTREFGLFVFPAPTTKKETKYGRNEVERFCQAHGGEPPGTYHYKSESFLFEDADFDSAVWERWHQVAGREPDVWVRIAKGIMGDWSEAWSEVAKGHIRYASSRDMRLVDHTPLIATWILKLQGLPCLPDDLNTPQLPSALFQINADTSPLVGIERFVNEKLDRSQNREFLDLLGVRKKPESSTKLVDRLRYWTQVPDAPLSAIVDLYRLLDRVAARLDAPGQDELRDVFENERLIRSADGSWQDRSSVFQRNEDDIPGVAIVMSQVSDLPLWSRLGVLERPTLQRALSWLKKLEYETLLDTGDRSRIRALLRQAPNQIWSELEGWLDLDGRWIKPAKFYWHSYSAGNKEKALFNWVKQKTADLSMLDRNMESQFPGARLPSLEQALSQKVANPRNAEPQPLPTWLTTFASTVTRISTHQDEEDGAENLNRIADRAIAFQLMDAKWHPVPRLEIEPYLDGQPAGQPHAVKAIWEGDRIYVAGPSPSHHRELVETLVSRFRDSEIRAAVINCTGRDAQFIKDYLASEFRLVTSAPTISTSSAKSSVGPVEQDGHVVITPPVGSTRTNPPNSSPPVPVAAIGRPLVPQAPRSTPREDPQEKFLEGLGFRWTTDRHYLVDQYGNSLQRGDGIFDWIKYDSTGTATDYYWISNKPLEEGVEIGVDDWEAMRRYDDKAWLVVPNLSEEFEAYKWSYMHRQIQREELSLHPLVYLLRKPASS